MVNNATHFPIPGYGVHHLGLVLRMIEVLILRLAQMPVCQHLSAFIPVCGLLGWQGPRSELSHLLIVEPHPFEGEGVKRTDC
jgi:hypothetical protein